MGKADAITAKGVFQKEPSRANRSQITPGSFFLNRRTLTDWVHTGIVLDADNDERVSKRFVEMLGSNSFVSVPLVAKDEVIGVELPITVELEITETDPGYKGDTATGGTKPATLETGVTIQVPLFVNPGDVIKVDTRNGTYLERI